jgi:hypothetical protein
MLPHPLQFCIEQELIDPARTFQKKLLNLFTKRSYASLQLVEALAHASKTTTVVELSQETPFQRSYSVINKVLNAFGAESLVKIDKTTNAEESVKRVQNSDSTIFSRITKPFSDLFFEMLPQEATSKFQLFALDATSTPRIHANTLEDRSYVHQANQIGIPVTIGLESSVLTYLPEHSTEEANWQLPVSLERISTDTTACKVAKTQLQLLAEFTPANFTVIVVDSAYGSLEPYSDDQVVIARGRTDRQGRRPITSNQIVDKTRGRPRKYGSGTIRFIEDLPPGTERGSDEESEYEDTIKHQRVDVLLNRWNDVYVEGHSELVDVVKVEIFSKDDCMKTLLPPLLLILSGKRRREITSLEAYQSYRRRFDIEHFFRFVKQKLLFCAYQTPELDHQISWWWFCCMAYWLLYHVRHIGQGSTRPWHKKRDPTKPAGPGEVKRLFATSIFPVLGSPSRPPTNREKSRGRKLGTRFPKRERKKVVKKYTVWRKAA